MHRPLLLVTMLSLTSLAACSGDDPAPGSSRTDSEPGESAQPSDVLGPWQVAMDDGGAWSITPVGADAPVIASPGADVAALGIGTPRVFEAAGQLHLTLDGPRGLEWLTPRQAERVAVDNGLAMRLTFAGADGEPVHATLSFRLLEGEHLRIGLDFDGNPLPTAELRFACQEDEAFFGLGTQVTGMDLGGRVYPLITQEQGIGKPENPVARGLQNDFEAAYAPMAIWHSSAGYSAIGDFDTYAQLGLCVDGERSFLRTHEGAPALVLVPGASIRERMAPLTAPFPDGEGARLPAAPPDWVFAPWLSAVGGPEEIAHVRRTARERGWPASVIWTEDWIGGTLTSTGFRLSYRWAWDPDTYPDLPGIVRSLNEDGFAFLGYFNPFVPTTVPHHDEARDRGFLVRDRNGEVWYATDPASRRTALIDLHNPEAVAWLQGFLRTAAAEVGLHGWMADFAEWYPSTADVPEGVSALARRNAYPVLWQLAHREVLDDVHGQGGHVFFARSGWGSTRWRTGQVIPALWGGDQNTDWKYDDGYPTVIPIGVHAGLSGVPIFGSDIAGYASFVNAPSDKELWFRWATLGALSPLMRTHHGSSKCDNWRFDRDEDTLAHFGRWMRVHALLLPYFRLAMSEALEQGLPIMRHPVLVVPEARALWQGRAFQYFLGDDLLVAPVLEQGATGRTALLPDEGWWPIFGDAPVGGGARADGLVAHEAEAPATEIPVFVRPGTALPLLGREVDTFFPAASPDVRDLRHAEGTARAVLYPDAAGVVQERAWEGVRLSAEGLAVGGASLAVSDDDGALPVCAEDEPAGTASRCVAANGRRIHGTWADATLHIGDGGRILLASDDGEPRTWTVGIGGLHGWDALALPTPLGSLSPELPPLCPPESSGASSSSATAPPASGVGSDGSGPSENAAEGSSASPGSAGEAEASASTEPSAEADSDPAGGGDGRPAPSDVLPE